MEMHREIDKYGGYAIHTWRVQNTKTYIQDRIKLSLKYRKDNEMYIKRLSHIVTQCSSDMMRQHHWTSKIKNESHKHLSKKIE